MTREEAIIHLENMHMKYDEFYHNLNCADQLLIERGNEALEMAIQALESLDKIRAEIAEYKDDKIIHAERNEMIDIVLDIIDKYKAESEEE